MHEFGVAAALIEAATQAAVAERARRVTRVTFRIGVLRQIDGTLMTDAFDLVSRGTICEGATLHVEKTYMQAGCPKCDTRFEVREWNWACPECGADGDLVGGGDELDLVSLDAEIDE